MSLKLDDLLGKKKEPVQILDLSKSTANTNEELKKLLEKVPEFKIKIEKVKPEDVKIYDKKFTFKTPKKELKRHSFPFTNPIPTEMKSLCLDDLCSIAIQWKMLTSLRPKNKLDEEYYSKLVELGKFQTTSREKEKKIPLTSYFRKSKNKAGVLETRVVSCRDCGEEFCASETCRQFAYDLYERENVSKQTESTDQGNVANEQNQERVQRSKKRMKLKKRIPKKEVKGTMKAGLLRNANSNRYRCGKIGVKLQKKRKLLPTVKQSITLGNKIGKSSSQKKGIKKNSSDSLVLKSRRSYLPARPHHRIRAAKIKRINRTSPELTAVHSKKKKGRRENSKKEENKM